METHSAAESDPFKLKLVLPKTFFSQAFLGPFEATAKAFRDASSYHFIANLVIEVTSCRPENSVMAATTQKVWDEFSVHVRKHGFVVGGEAFLRLFENMMVIVPTDNWGKLNETDSVIALADRLYSISKLDPLLVVNDESVENFRRAAAAFYGKDPDHIGSLDIPFKIYNPAQTVAYLQATFPKESIDVLAKTDPPFNVL